LKNESTPFRCGYQKENPLCNSDYHLSGFAFGKGGAVREYGPVCKGEGKVRIFAEAWPSGDDWVVSVQGGDTPHVGAVALACPCAPPADTTGKITGFVSVLTAPGHRDDELARKLALQMCKDLQRNISLSVGIHVHNATQEEISTLVKNAEEAVTGLLSLLRK